MANISNAPLQNDTELAFIDHGDIVSTTDPNSNRQEACCGVGLS
jgi:hypothetical protein